MAEYIEDAFLLSIRHKTHTQENELIYLSENDFHDLLRQFANGTIDRVVRTFKSTHEYELTINLNDWDIISFTKYDIKSHKNKNKNNNDDSNDSIFAECFEPLD